MQTRAVIKADTGTSTTSFIQDLGAVGVGMVPFNIGMAIAAPIVAIGFAIWMFRSRKSPLAVAVAGPVLGMAVFLTAAVPGALSAGVNPLYSYYVLKSLDSLLLAASPLFAALVGIGIATLLSGLSRKDAVVAAVVAGVFGVMLFGYVGPTPKEFAPGFSAAPGIAAGAKRIESVNNTLVGEAIINAQQAAEKFPELTTMLWDGAGTLPNLWVASLHGVMSQTQQAFYKNLPQFPYDENTVTYVKSALNTNPTLNLVVLWFRDVTGLLVEPLQKQYPTRVVTEKVPMRSSPLCLECSL
jgi:ABC-type transport system involved in multi-copper enzyme maturation permease subunit